MSPSEKLVVGIEICLAAGILVGLLVRGHSRSCYSFVTYLAAFVVLEGAVLAAPERFFHLDFWLLKEAIQGLLKLAIACEIAARAFFRLPRARGVFALALLVSLVTIAAALWPAIGADAETVARIGLPRVLYGTAVIFAALLAFCLWYHVPLHGIHKAVLLGFVTYLVAFTLALQTLHTFGWDMRGLANSINTAAFISLLAFWARIAWRRSTTPTVSPAVLSYLQPWTRADRA